MCVAIMMMPLVRVESEINVSPVESFETEMDGESDVMNA